MGPWLITAGRVYDGVAERALERAYVVVDGDTITAVGPQTELEGHAGRFAQVIDRKSTRLNSSHSELSRMPSSA